MSALFRIVYAAHANGTHHKLALDSLRHMERPDAEAWTRVFLKHVALYLEGSKAPDDSFKDFKNHVLHVREKYWGGAPEKVEAWYGHLVEALRAQKWPDAAYAAGVLSHYFSDPIHPFHTAQSEAENSIHRAVEWSINRSYNELRALGERRLPNFDVPVSHDTHWLRELVCDGAEFANGFYEKLIAHYDFNRGVVRPTEGLDDVGRNVVADLLIYAADGFGHILDHAIEESGAIAPEVNLTLDTIVAALKVPAKWWQKRLSNAEDRAIVQAMYDELQATGRVEQSLPEDDKLIRDLHAREVLAPQLAKQQAQRATRVPDGDPADIARRQQMQAAALKPVAPAALAGDTALARAVAKSAGTKPTTRAELPPQLPNAAPPVAKIDQGPLGLPVRDTFAKPAAPNAAPAAAQAKAMPPAIPAPPSISSADAKPASAPAAKAAEPPAAAVKIEPPAATPPPATAPALAPAAAVVIPPAAVTAPQRPHASDADAADDTDAGDDGARRSFLAMTDDLEAAPSIGPKMAQRFNDLGIYSVADFLGHDPHDMAELLDDSRFDAEVLTDWQDQAQLVIDVPGLRGTHAQLLVGAGYRTAEAVADADPVDLSADVLTFAATSEGKRVLRDGHTPDLEKIKAWVEYARLAFAA